MKIIFEHIILLISKTYTSFHLSETITKFQSTDKHLKKYHQLLLSNFYAWKYSRLYSCDNVGGNQENYGKDVKPGAV